MQTTSNPLSKHLTMASKSKFFRVAVEGATTDGRRIERDWIEQMARNYDPETYGARIWMEHMRSTYSDNVFGAYGDVKAVKAETVTLAGKKKLALFAQIEPLPELVKMNGKKQKIYTSIEVNPDFSDTGEAYLVGLGVTDSPASLGTEVLAFAAQKPDASPFKGRKLHEGNLFTEAIEVDLDFDDEGDDDSDDGKPAKFSAGMAGLKAKLETFAKRFKKADGDNAALAEVVGELVEGMGDAVEAYTATQDELKKLKKSFSKVEELAADLKAKVDKIDTTDPTKFTQRPPATGGNANQVEKTDC